MKISVIHGPNLQMLGLREPSVYGSATLDEINTELERLAKQEGIELDFFQSNHEGEILDYLAGKAEGVSGFLINPGGLTHTSVSLRDGLLGAGKPFVEVHLSNTAAREAFRHQSMISSAAVGVVTGFGVDSYLLGLRGLSAHLKRS